MGLPRAGDREVSLPCQLTLLGPNQAHRGRGGSWPVGVAWSLVVKTWSLVPCRLQQERMALLQGILEQREADHQALNERRLEHLW